MRGAFPELGEHNHQILSEILGYSDEDIEALYEDEILHHSQ